MYTNSETSEPILIEQNSAQDIESKIKLCGITFMGSTINIIVICFVIGLVFFGLLFDISIIAAIISTFIPIVFGIFFIKKFISNKPKYYFTFWVQQCFFGACIRKKGNKK